MASSGSRPNIVVLGGINMDLIGVAPKLPAPGETVVGERFYTAPGDKGANQAVAAARLGARVRMIGRVGTDTFGPMLVANLLSQGIETQDVAEDSENASGIAMILLDSRRQHHITAIYGANAACDSAQLEATKRALEKADALLLQQEIPVPVSLAAAQQARSTGLKVVWDPAPPMEVPHDLYAAVDVLTPNQTETEYITGIRVTDVDSARSASKAMLELGAAAAVVKMGEHGVYFATTSQSEYVPAHEVETVDSVAAGDAFGAALGVALAEGKSVLDSVRFGAAAGALAVTKPGAQDAMPSRDEVEAMIAGS